jgi:F-type H+-transporting ATPase subunit alpha
VEVLKQKNKAPVEVAHQVCIIYAVVNGYLKNVQVSQIAEFELRLRDFMDNRYANVLETIRSTGKLEQETEDALKAALEELLNEF